MFSGSIVAIVTPFKDGQVDFDTLAQLVDFHVQAGTDAIVPCGTTGESPTLSHQEHDRVIEETIRAADGRVPVIAGTGSNSTTEALRLTRHAAEAGADGALLVCPYYNKPSQEGLYQHFATLAEIDIPQVLYNIPGRTGVNLLPTTIARLAKHKNIETNPVPVKTAMNLLGRLNGEVRMPLVPLLPENRTKLANALTHFGLPLA